MNIAKILEKHSKGLKLYSPIFGEVIFEGINPDGWIVCTTAVTKMTELFYPEGNYSQRGEVMLFPSKTNRNWETFPKPFVNGDIVTCECGAAKQIFIFKEYATNGAAICYCFLDVDDRLSTNSNIYYVTQHATQQEKERFFIALNKHGYRWNPDTKTLSKLPKFKKGDTITNNKLTIKITHVDDKYYYSFSNKVTHSLLIESQDEWKLVTQPKFKKGDKVRVKGGVDYRTIKDVCETFYTLIPIGKIDFTDQDNWELVIEPIFKVGDRVRLNNSKFILTITDILKDRYRATIDSNDLYEIEFERQDAYKLVHKKFDIRTLKPFDKVLVRPHHMAEWKVDFFSHYTEGADFPYNTVGNSYRCNCIPFKGNEYLRGTTDDCNNFYKTWEE